MKYIFFKTISIKMIVSIKEQLIIFIMLDKENLANNDQSYQKKVQI